MFYAFTVHPTKEESTAQVRPQYLVSIVSSMLALFLTRHKHVKKGRRESGGSAEIPRT